VLLDVTPLSVGLETLGGVMTKAIEHNPTIPARRSETVSTPENNQTAIDGSCYKASVSLPSTIGNWHVSGWRAFAAARGPQVEVSFDVDANGIVNVFCA
jgi:molecular chaperone DnaK